MKFLLPIILFYCTLMQAQVEHSVLYTKTYDELSIPVRVENCGIYGISGFDIHKNDLHLTLWNSSRTITLSGNTASTSATETITGDIAVDTQGDLHTAAELPLNNEPYNGTPSGLKKTYVSGEMVMLAGSEGIMMSRQGDEISLTVASRSSLEYSINCNSLNLQLTINFPNDLAYADLIGIDAQGNSFLLIERFERETPLKVKREVRVYSAQGEELSLLNVPLIKYLSTVKDFTIDAEGNLYHLLTYRDHFELMRWSGLTAGNTAAVEYPAEYRQSIHFNDFVTTDEFEGETKSGNEPELLASRLYALKLGDDYALHQYQCNAGNIAYDPVQAPDGDMVQTPGWLVEGWNARIPYKWGGFNTLSGFDAGLASGKYAGDIHTGGVSNYAVGLDCSGFVSRCWGMTWHASTSYMPNITTVYGSWNDLKPGDAIHKVGHVRLFVKRNPNGSFKVVEAAGRNWDVSYWSFSASDLTNYDPRYYENMESEYNDQFVDLRSAMYTGGNMVTLDWTCPGVNVAGYRLYQSNDNKTWSLVLDETELQNTITEYEITDSVNFFRVSSVLNEAQGSLESFWSYPLVVKKSASTKKLLLIDGFQRNSGSWQGYGNPFVARNGEMLSKHNYQLESIDDDYLMYNNIQLSDYDIVYWIAGDESSVDSTITPAQQSIIASYLENGGSFYISGSEIGWDLVTQGDAADQAFYADYLKAEMLYDDANSQQALGVAGTLFADLDFYFGQTYVEDYPDGINTHGGSNFILKYHNGYGAGIAYSGKFGSGSTAGKLIYIAFPPETSADDLDFSLLTDAVIAYFEGVPSSLDDTNVPAQFSLKQNYPNPFNPATMIEFTIAERSVVKLTIYNQLGEIVAELLNKELQPGSHQYQFNAGSLASGVYLYHLEAGTFSQTHKMLLLK